MRARRVAAAVIGALLAVIGFGAVTGGTVLAAFEATQRDDAGFIQLPATRLETPTAGLVTPLDLGRGAEDVLQTVRLDASAAGSAAVFIGIGPAQEVREWLSNVAYDQVSNWGYGPAPLVARRVDGTASARSPATAPFWVASASGSVASLTWRSAPGEWAIVVMNASGSPGVAADVTAGSSTGLVAPFAVSALIVGILLVAGGLTLALAGVRRESFPEPIASVPGSYPVRLEGRLDPDLSRWLWLVKWLLAVPHYVLLGLLWLAVVPLTVVAGLAILFTGRYPRSIFEFTVGVMRWTWRASYYTFSALGTDRYPPFTLDSVPDYPADLSVDYPARLSRGLVLVKWWLLAIPHLLVVAVLAGGWVGIEFGDGNWWFVLSGADVIGVLVLIAAIVLAVTGTYPAALFDVVMGMNRWCYRVLAYVCLMRDEYPPFRFDAGGPDPGTAPRPVSRPAPRPEPVGPANRT
jgi:hypothetical protein